MTYPTFDLFPAPPEGSSPEAVKEIVQANNAILEYRQKVAEAETSGEEAQIDLEKSRIDLERARVELDRYKAVVGRDTTDYQFRTGHFTLYDFVDDYSVKSLINDISSWHNHTDPSMQLTVTLNSYGGSVVDGFHLFDTLRNVSEEGRKVVTIGMGVTASMGGILLQAGDERVLAPNASLMIHEVSYGTRGKASDNRDMAEWADMLWSRVVDIYTARSTVSREEFDLRAKRRDWWLLPEEALKYGFIDRIGYK